MKTLSSPIKPWHRLGISKRQYLSAKPWKEAEMSRERYESILMMLPQDAIDSVRIAVEADTLVEALFGKETVD